jgi:hypothetical protein
VNPDGVRDYDLLIPRSAEGWVDGHYTAARDEAVVEAEAWRARLLGDRGDRPPDPGA